jgi:hypothetical protein
MTLYQFNGLDEMEQIECVWNHAVSLAKREDENYKYELFQIEGFYIETRCRHDDPGYDAINTFTTGKFLEPYLVQMKIKNIIN